MCSDAEHAMKVLTMCAGQPLSTLAMLRWAVDARAWQPSEQQWRMILAHCLPERERQRCLSYQQADDQKRGVLSQLLQRACISRLLDSATPWQQLPIERTPGGKPFYSGSAARQDAPNLNYNVSHEVSGVCCWPRDTWVASPHSSTMPPALWQRNTTRSICCTCRVTLWCW
jgi:hypothetical protein